MTFSHRNSAQEQKEACQQAKQITTMCEQLHIPVDPIDWQNCGMRACVTVNAIEISDLLSLILRSSRRKLTCEMNALKTV